MKPHLDIENGDLCAVVKGKKQGRVGVVVGIRYDGSYKDTLIYTLLDEETHKYFNMIGAYLKLLVPCYLSQGNDAH